MDKIDLEQLKQKTKDLKILYVEDDLDSRSQMHQIFELFFNSITVAENGLEALEIFKNGQFDLIITDINMPKMDGITMSEKIKNINPEQKIIIVSAHDSGDYLLSAIRIGVDGFLIKPVEIEQLQNVLNKISSVINNEKIKLFYQKELEQDVAEKTKKLLEQAFTDDLTNLYNRKKLMIELSKNTQKVLMLLNIDNFENINISYGYDNGDLILQQISTFLKNNLSDKCTLFRAGHDEFAFLFLESTLIEVEKFAKELQKNILKSPIKHEDVSVKFTTTIVIAEGKSNLLKDVHIAFKQVRSISKNRIGIYHPNSEIELKQQNIQKFIHIIHNSIENKFIEPFFQPIINNKSNKIEKYECLARIMFNNEILSPYQFIETAELTGMLPEITKIMIDKSFKTFQNREEEFSINISEYDLNDEYLEKYLEDMILKYSINPSRVVLEVLEGISASSAEKNYTQLVKLKNKGFQLAIDDFGAQNSNFERVHRLKVDYIKIDGSFIKHIDSDTNSYNVAKTITDFSKSVGAKVIAEYVHNESVLNKVLNLGIDYSQGYHLGEPTQSL